MTTCRSWLEAVMKPLYVIKNGEVLEKGQANVSVYNKALFFDFAVYSNIKVVGGRMFLPGLEIEKLFESAKSIGLDHGFTKADINDWTRKLIRKNELKDALIRVLLIGPEMGSDPMLFLFPVGLTFYKKSLYNNGAKLVTYNGERTFPRSKTKDLLLGYTAYRKALKEEALDALLVDSDGNVREGTRSSFFVIKGDTLIAPPERKVLEGVTRKIILEIAPKILKVEERDIPLKSLWGYDEYFITGTTLNIMPVRQINNVVLRSRVGKYTAKLQSLFRAHCDKKYVSV